MTDNRTRQSRSALMSRIRGKDTAPELVVRRLLHGMGYRYRLHRRDLPGKPDIVFPTRRTVIFVHGCFWHAHGCKKGQPPKTRLDFWTPKLQRNTARDRANESTLIEAGWTVLTVWQCDTQDLTALASKLVEALGAPAAKNPIDSPSSDA